MLLEIQSKQISLTMSPKQKECIYCARHITAWSKAGGGVWCVVLFSLETTQSNYLKSLTSHSNEPLPRLPLHYSDELCDAVCLLTKAAV